jgi:hypothetical protein
MLVSADAECFHSPRLTGAGRLLARPHAGARHHGGAQRDHPGHDAGHRRPRRLDRAPLPRAPRRHDHALEPLPRGAALVEDVGSWDEDGELLLPIEIGGKKVRGHEGDLVLGEELVPYDDFAVIILEVGEYERALSWLEQRDWHEHQDFAAIWTTIRAVLEGVR